MSPTWEVFAADVRECTGVQVEPSTRLQEIATGPLGALAQLTLLIHLETVTGEEIDLDLFESIETATELFEWCEVILDRRQPAS